MQAYNEVLLEGIPTGTPERSHENHGQVFYRQFIEVPRLSGTADLLPMLLRQEQLAGVHSGEPLRIDGQLRSFNNRTVTVAYLRTASSGSDMMMSGMPGGDMGGGMPGGGGGMPSGGPGGGGPGGGF